MIFCKCTGMLYSDQLVHMWITIDFAVAWLLWNAHFDWSISGWRTMGVEGKPFLCVGRFHSLSYP